MIDLTGIQMPESVLGDTARYKQLLYLYSLDNPDHTPYYVGSTLNPASRYLTHLAGDCKDSAPRTLELVKSNTPSTMRVLDIALPEQWAHRYHYEGYYIGLAEQQGYTLANTDRYRAEGRKVRACKPCYRSVKFGTLL